MAKNPNEISNPEYRPTVAQKEALTNTTEDLLRMSPSTEIVTDDSGNIVRTLHTSTGDGLDITSTTQDSKTQYELSEWLGTRITKFEWSSDPTDTVSTITFMDERGLKSIPMNNLMFGVAQGAVNATINSLKTPKSSNEMVVKRAHTEALQSTKLAKRLVNKAVKLVDSEKTARTFISPRLTYKKASPESTTLALNSELKSRGFDIKAEVSRDWDGSVADPGFDNHLTIKEVDEKPIIPSIKPRRS